MIDIFIILILICVILSYTAVCGAIGFYFGKTVKPRPRERPVAATTPEQKRAAEKAAREYSNFLNYDGSEQEEVI